MLADLEFSSLAEEADLLSLSLIDLLSNSEVALLSDSEANVLSLADLEFSSLAEEADLLSLSDLALLDLLIKSLSLIEWLSNALVEFSFDVPVECSKLVLLLALSFSLPLKLVDVLSEDSADLLFTSESLRTALE